jgi:hypothetical protein
MVCDMARVWDKSGKVELWMLCVNGNIDEWLSERIQVEGW